MPRYASVAAILAEGIANGDPPVGGLLPTEQDLSSRFGVSRATIREALRRLRGMGLISATQGVGTRVIAHQPLPTYEMAVRSLADLMGYASPTTLVIERREQVVVKPALAAALGASLGSPMLRLSGVRRTSEGDRAVLSCVDMYVPVEFAAMTERPELGRVQVYRLIERHFGLRVVDMHQDIGAIRLGAAEARRLGVPAGSPGLRIVRRFFAARGKLLEATINIHAAVSKFSYQIRMTAPQ